MPDLPFSLDPDRVGMISPTLGLLWFDWTAILVKEQSCDKGLQALTAFAIVPNLMDVMASHPRYFVDYPRDH